MLAEYKVEIREGTTRYVSIDCMNAHTGQPFDFDGYSIQTWLEFGGTGAYIPTTITRSTVGYMIPASMSVGSGQGVAETRIMKNGDVFEVLRVLIRVHKASKPDTTHHEPE